MNMLINFSCKYSNINHSCGPTAGNMKCVIVNDCRMLTNQTILECIITVLWIVLLNTKPFS